MKSASREVCAFCVLSTDDVLDDLLDQVLPDFVLVFTFAGRATYVITLQDYPLLIPVLKVVSPEEAVLVQDLHFLHHVLVKFVSFERVVLMLIEMKYDKVLLDLPFSEILVGIVTEVFVTIKVLSVCRCRFRTYSGISYL